MPVGKGFGWFGHKRAAALAAFPECHTSRHAIRIVAWHSFCVRDVVGA